MSASKPPQRLVEKIKPLISEVMGARSGEIFYKFYELEDDEEVMTGAKALLYELMGRNMAEQKLKDWKRK